VNDYTDFSKLTRPIESTSRLISGWNVRPIAHLPVPGGSRGPYSDAFKRKCIELAPGESFTIANIKGPGVISRIYFTFPFRVPRILLRAIDLLIYWDDEPNPSVCVPIGDFFGAAFCQYREYDALPQSMLNGGYVSRFPMPFRKHAKVILRNSSPLSFGQLFYGITYYSDVEITMDTLYFHAQWRRTNPTVEGVPHTVLDAQGAGNYVGCHVSEQNRDAWICRRPLGSILPGGFGMGQMEGWEEIFIDGNVEPLHHGTGLEEYFNAGAYFTHGRSTGVLDGCTRRNYLTGRVAAYRFQVVDPIPFKKSFKMIWHHGLLDSIRADYASTAFWYQTEPHLHLDLPAFAERKPSSVVPHVLRATALLPLVLGSQMYLRFFAT